jgi:hypothetical protein
MDRPKCTVVRYLEIVPAGLDEYNELGRFHYREGAARPHVAIYAIKDMHPLVARLGGLAGVIVYTMPVPNLELRNVATDGRFTGLGDRRMQLQMANKYIRCISRVIIEPRYRGLGLAGWLVAETMPRLGVPIVEAVAVMGRVNPFFERAGMNRYEAKSATRSEQLTEALGMVDIDKRELIEPQVVQDKLDGLSGLEAEFIERQIDNFLQTYGKRSQMPAGIERTRYVLSKLTSRPVYYIWFNPDKQLAVRGKRPRCQW